MTRLILGGLMTLLAVALAFHARASDEPAWQFSQMSGPVRYATHGTTVHGHRLGFIKKRGRCDDDILRLFDDLVPTTFPSCSSAGILVLKGEPSGKSRLE